MPCNSDLLIGEIRLLYSLQVMAVFSQFIQTYTYAPSDLDRLLYGDTALIAPPCMGYNLPPAAVAQIVIVASNSCFYAPC